MANCKHENTVVEPSKLRTEGDGVAFSIDNDARFSCRDCEQELPTEDIPHYDKNKMSVAIPKDLVDG